VTLTDADYMARALFHAARGRGRTSPNPVVGAVVVTVVGTVVSLMTGGSASRSSGANRTA